MFKNLNSIIKRYMLTKYKYYNSSSDLINSFAPFSPVISNHKVCSPVTERLKLKKSQHCLSVFINSVSSSIIESLVLNL